MGLISADGIQMESFCTMQLHDYALLHTTFILCPRFAVISSLQDLGKAIRTNKDSNRHGHVLALRPPPYPTNPTVTKARKHMLKCESSIHTEQTTLNGNAVDTSETEASVPQSESSATVESDVEAIVEGVATDSASNEEVTDAKLGEPDSIKMDPSGRPIPEQWKKRCQFTMQSPLPSYLRSPPLLFAHFTTA